MARIRGETKLCRYLNCSEQPNEFQFNFPPPLQRNEITILLHRFYATEKQTDFKFSKTELINFGKVELSICIAAFSVNNFTTLPMSNLYKY